MIFYQLVNQSHQQMEHFRVLLSVLIAVYLLLEQLMAEYNFIHSMVQNLQHSKTFKIQELQVMLLQSVFYQEIKVLLLAIEVI